MLVLAHWLKDPELQAHFKAKAAMVNARNGIIPSILRQTTGTQARQAPRKLCPVALPNETDWKEYMILWKRMSKKEKAEWYLKEKEPLLQAMIVVEQEKLHLVSKSFNALQGVLEIIATHMVRMGWDDQVEADRLRKNARAKERQAEKDARIVAEKKKWVAEHPEILMARFAGQRGI